MAESTILVREREGEEGAGTVEIELDSVDESRESRRPKIGEIDKPGKMQYLQICRRIWYCDT